MTSRTGAHAVRAMVQLALLPAGRFAGAGSLSKRIAAPPNYLGKLLLALSREGLVESRKGSGGGFRLARDPASITLLDVLAPIESPGKWAGCFLGRPVCSDEAPCAMHDGWVKVRRDYLAMLSNTTLAEIVERSRGSDASPRMIERSFP